MEQVSYDFSAPHRQSERALGFWFYLISDAILFAVLFANYAVLLGGTAGGPAPADVFTLWRVAAETSLLLTSSLTFGLMNYSALSQKKAMASFWLVVTIVLGAAFLVLELGEFAEMAAKGATPQRSGFLSAFFFLVGTHGLHVTFGTIWLVTLMVQVWQKGLIPANKRRLMCLSLFWHFLDVIWIGVFTFVYLFGMLR